MKPIPNNVDWSATAAWIALVISVTGTFAGPIITAILTNRHQLKLRKLDIAEKISSERMQVIQQCISSIGAYMATINDSNKTNLGKDFYAVYAYVPLNQWEMLDTFYLSATSNKNFQTAKEMLPQVIHLLASLLTEESPKNP